MTDDSAATRLARSLMHDVLRGAIPPGAPLPSVRALALREQVSTGTVHRALAQVAQAGLVEVRGRSRAVARDPAAHADLATLPAWLEALADQPDAAGRLLAEFLEVRRALAAALITRHHARVLAEVSALAVAYEAVVAASTRGSAAFMAADLAFSRALVSATGNRAALAVFTTAVRLLERVPAVAAAMYADPATHLDAHAAVWGALAGPGDPTATLEAAIAAVDARTVERFVRGLRGAP